MVYTPLMIGPAAPLSDNRSRRRTRAGDRPTEQDTFGACSDDIFDAILLFLAALLCSRHTS